MSLGFKAEVIDTNSRNSYIVIVSIYFFSILCPSTETHKRIMALTSFPPSKSRGTNIAPMHSAITKRLLESGISSFWHFGLVFLALFEFEVLSVSLLSSPVPVINSKSINRSKSSYLPLLFQSFPFIKRSQRHFQVRICHSVLSVGGKLRLC